MEQLTVGRCVSVLTHQGFRGNTSELRVLGVIESIIRMPWGWDALIRLYSPTMVGNPEHPPTDRLSVSVDSPLLTPA